VCPTHAIQPFAPEDKAHIYIGTARIDHSACLMWQDSVKGKRCLVCDEHCPYDAIYVGIGPNGRKVPYVNEALCVGCGTCEHACPVGPQAAIRVLNEAPFGDKRQRSGKEQQAWQQRMAPMYPSDK
jgi:heterodisulfide reductase subunit A-like polyferredoxin